MIVPFLWEITRLGRDCQRGLYATEPLSIIPPRYGGNKPITIGQGYSTLAFLPDEERSFALPLLHERIQSTTDPIKRGADQLCRVSKAVKGRPISLWDSEYGCAPFVEATADIDADQVIRIRPNRCLWGPPPPYRGWGRPPVHGAKFKLSDPKTWPEPTETLYITDEKLGPVLVQRFENLHFRQAPKHPFCVIRIHRINAKDTKRAPKDLFIAWIGQDPPSLQDWWPLYLKRFAIECWYHFAKSRLHWTLPRFKTPQQSERWSDLMPPFDLAGLDGKIHRGRLSPALAETTNKSHPQTGRSESGRYFKPRLVHQPVRPNYEESRLDGLKDSLERRRHAILW